MLLARKHLPEGHGWILASANTCILQGFAQGGVRQEGGYSFLDVLLTSGEVVKFMLGITASRASTIVPAMGLHPVRASSIRCDTTACWWVSAPKSSSGNAGSPSRKEGSSAFPWMQVVDLRKCVWLFGHDSMQGPGGAVKCAGGNEFGPDLAACLKGP